MKKNVSLSDAKRLRLFLGMCRSQCGFTRNMCMHAVSCCCEPCTRAIIVAKHPRKNNEHTIKSTHSLHPKDSARTYNTATARDYTE